MATSNQKKTGSEFAKNYDVFFSELDAPLLSRLKLS
jgi:hypothetical protein